MCHGAPAPQEPTPRCPPSAATCFNRIRFTTFGAPRRPRHPFLRIALGLVGVALLLALLFVSVFVGIAMLAVGMLYRLWKHRNTPGLDRAKRRARRHHRWRLPRRRQGATAARALNGRSGFRRPHRRRAHAAHPGPRSRRQQPRHISRCAASTASAATSPTMRARWAPPRRLESRPRQPGVLHEAGRRRSSSAVSVPYPPGTSDLHHEVELVVALGRMRRRRTAGRCRDVAGVRLRRRPGPDPPRPAGRGQGQGPALGHRQGLRPFRAGQRAGAGRPRSTRLDAHVDLARRQRRASPAVRPRPADLGRARDPARTVEAVCAARRRPGVHGHARRRGRAATRRPLPRRARRHRGIAAAACRRAAV